MKKYIQGFIAITLITAGLIGSSLFTVSVFAQAPPTTLPPTTPPPTTPPPATTSGTPADSACAGIEAAGGSCDTTTGGQGFNNIMTVVVNTLSVVVGAVSVVMIIVGGFRYVISAGDSNSLGAAKNTILYALVGLVIVLFAQVIVQFVFVKATQSAAPTGGSCDPADPTCVTPPPVTPPPVTCTPGTNPPEPAGCTP